MLEDEVGREKGTSREAHVEERGKGVTLYREPGKFSIPLLEALFLSLSLSLSLSRSISIASSPLSHHRSSLSIPLPSPPFPIPARPHPPLTLNFMFWKGMRSCTCMPACWKLLPGAKWKLPATLFT